MDINCPHCGTTQITELTTSKNAFCSFCGSSLLGVLDDIRKNQHQSLGNRENVGISNNSAGLPFSSPENVPSLPRAQFNQTDPFQTSNSSQHVPFQTIIEQTSFPTKQFKATLTFSQLNKSINLPINDPVFHFGRNLILPIVDKTKFDVVWLNTISRIRKQNHQVVHQHFTITRTNDGRYFIEDKLSRWGTWLNRNQIKNKGKTQLHNGDRIELMLSKPNVKQVFPFVIIFETK